MNNNERMNEWDGICGMRATIVRNIITSGCVDVS